MITRSMIPVVPRMLLDLQQHSFKKFEMNSCYSLPLSCNLKRIYVHIIFEFPKNSPHLNTSDSRHLVHIHWTQTGLWGCFPKSWSQHRVGRMLSVNSDLLSHLSSERLTCSTCRMRGPRRKISSPSGSTEVRNYAFSLKNAASFMINQNTILYIPLLKHINFRNEKRNQTTTSHAWHFGGASGKFLRSLLSEFLCSTTFSHLIQKNCPYSRGPGEQKKKFFLSLRSQSLTSLGEAEENRTCA